MLCLHCGTTNTDVVTYCTKCGANLSAIKSALLALPPAAEPGNTVSSRIYMTVLILSALIALVGIPTVIGGIIALIAIAKDAGLPAHELTPLLGFFAILGFGGVVASIWLLLRSMNSRQIVDDKTRRAIAPPPMREQLPPPSRYVSAPLREQQEQYSSVTEHTTAHLQDYVAPQHEPKSRS